MSRTNTAKIANEIIKKSMKMKLAKVKSDSYPEKVYTMFIVYNTRNILVKRSYCATLYY